MPNSPLATGARTRLSLVREAAFNVIPTNPAFQSVRPTNLTLSNVPKFTQSKIIRSDGMAAGQVLVDQDITAKYGAELCLDEHDDKFEAALRTTKVATPEIVKTVAEIGAVAASGVFNVSGTLGTPYKVGHLLRSTGFGVAGNNVVSRVTANAAGTVTAGAAATSVEATPPVGARLKIIGIEGAAAGSIAAVAGSPNKLTIATTDPSALGLAAGMWMKLNGFTGQVLNNDWVRILSITGTGPWNIVLDIVPTGWASDTAAGQVIRFFFTDYMRPGTTRNSYSAEEAHLDLGNYKYLSGLVINQLMASFKQGAIVDLSADLVGASGQWQAQVAGATYAAPPTTKSLNTSKNLGKIVINGTPAPGVVTAADITIKSAAEVQKALGTFGAADITYGAFSVDVTLSKFFLDTTLNALMMSGTPVGIAIIIFDALTGSGYVYDLRQVKLMDGQPSVSDATKPLEEPYKGTAEVDDVAGYMMSICKIEAYQ